MRTAIHMMVLVLGMCAALLSTVVYASITTADRSVTLALADGRIALCVRDVPLMRSIQSPIQGRGLEWSWRPFRLDLSTRIIGYPGSAWRVFPFAIAMLGFCGLYALFLVVLNRWSADRWQG